MMGMNKVPTLDRPGVYEIRVPGQLDACWTEWNGGMTVIVEAGSGDEPVTLLRGTVDQAALQGVLRRLYALGVPLISVIFLEPGAESA